MGLVLSTLVHTSTWMSMNVRELLITEGYFVEGFCGRWAVLTYCNERDIVSAWDAERVHGCLEIIRVTWHQVVLIGMTRYSFRGMHTKVAGSAHNLVNNLNLLQGLRFPFLCRGVSHKIVVDKDSVCNRHSGRFALSTAGRTLRLRGVSCGQFMRV